MDVKVNVNGTVKSTAGIEGDSAGVVPIAGGVTVAEQGFGQIFFRRGFLGGGPFNPEGGGQFFRKNFREPRRDRAGKKDAALVEAALFCAALGSAGQLVSLRVQNIRGNRFQEAGGVVLFGLGGGQTALQSNGLQGQGETFMDGAVGRKGAGEGEGMIGRQDQGVGQIAAVLDKTSTGVAPDEGGVGRNHRGFLKITDGDAGFLPAVKAKDGSLHVAKQGLIDGHVGGRGGLGIEEKAAGHC